MSATTTNSGSLLLSRLRRAVTKIRLLLNFNLLKQASRLTTLFGASRRQIQRRVSFDDRPGLIACTDTTPDTYHDDDDDGDRRSNVCPAASSSPYQLQRSTSSSPREDDVDKKAEMFISNFYRQLRLEKQISLELRYCRGNSFGSKSSANPSPDSSDGSSISISLS